MRVAIESGKGTKVKVVKLCWNKWNGPFLMHIYDKQCGIMQKWVPTFRFCDFKMGRQELCADNAKKGMTYIGWYLVKADVQSIPKML